jgi:hypothetical protein
MWKFLGQIKMELYITTLPHKKQRYPTVGDYFINDGLIRIRVSEMGNEDYEFLVALHEIVESWLVYRRGISEPDITAFDIIHEEVGGEGEPGDHPDAPYRAEHFFATTIERLMARELNVDWLEYDKVVEAL